MGHHMNVPPTGLTPEELAEANELHDAAVRLLLDALTGSQTEADR